MSPTFPAPYTHDHPPVVDVTAKAEGERTRGERAADFVAALVGSWRFIIVQSALLCVWVIVNVIGYIERWDPYPFILLNLMLSMQAAYTAPIIMMSQNRETQLDRLRAGHDFQINLKAEEEIRVVIEHLEAQSVVLQELLRDVRAIRPAVEKTT